MIDDLVIKNAIEDPWCGEVLKLYKDQKIRETFDGVRIDRLVASEYIFLLRSNEENIGFILLVRETSKVNYLTLDIGIIEKYRGKGYGKKTMEVFKNEYFNRINDEIHIQVRQDDIVANKLISILDLEYIESTNDSNFYKIVNKPKIKKKIKTNKKK